MNNKQKQVCKVEYKPNCFILVSGTQRPLKETFGDVKAVATVSFLYDAGQIAIEWEPEHGPIQIWEKCNKDDKGATEHYYFDYHNSPPGNWSQLAVDKYQLPKAFIDGDYEFIFSVLEEWADKGVK